MDLFKQKLDAQSSGIFDNEEGKKEESKEQERREAVAKESKR